MESFSSTTCRRPFEPEASELEAIEPVQEPPDDQLRPDAEPQVAAPVFPWFLRRRRPPAGSSSGAFAAAAVIAVRWYRVVVCDRGQRSHLTAARATRKAVSAPDNSNRERDEQRPHDAPAAAEPTTASDVTNADDRGATRVVGACSGGRTARRRTDLQRGRDAHHHRRARACRFEPATRGPWFVAVNGAAPEQLGPSGRPLTPRFHPGGCAGRFDRFGTAARPRTEEPRFGPSRGAGSALRRRVSRTPLRRLRFAHTAGCRAADQRPRRREPRASRRHRRRPLRRPQRRGPPRLRRLSPLHLLRPPLPIPTPAAPTAQAGRSEAVTQVASSAPAPTSVTGACRGRSCPGGRAGCVVAEVVECLPGGQLEHDARRFGRHAAQFANQRPASEARGARAPR
jgi:hypothetical protein